MIIRVIETFYDIEKKEHVFVGDEYYVNNERGNALISKGFVVNVNEKRETQKTEKEKQSWKMERLNQDKDE